MVKENRMRLPRIGTPEQDHVRLFDFAIGTCAATRSEDRRQTGDAWGVSSPVAAIDVVATDDGAHKFLRYVIQFIGRLGATEHPKSSRAARFHFAVDAARGELQSFVPGCRAMLSIFANQGSSYALTWTSSHTSPLGTRILKANQGTTGFYRELRLYGENSCAVRGGFKAQKSRARI
jgi:hypothetical protein